MISVYAPHCGLDDSQKNDFYDSLLMLLKSWGEKEIVVTVEDFNGHVKSNPVTLMITLEVTVRSNPEEYEGWYESYGYRGRNKEGERFLEFCAAINMTLQNTFFKNSKSPSPSHL